MKGLQRFQLGKQATATIAAVACLALMLTALTYDLFGGNRAVLGERQIAAMGLASLALVLLSWHYGRGGFMVANGVGMWALP